MTQLSILFALALLPLSLILAHPVVTDVLPGAVRFGCLAEPPAELIDDVVQLVKSKGGNINPRQADIFTQRSELTTRATIQIKVFFHVVAAAKTLADGYVSDTTLKYQLDELNRDYAASGITFIKGGIDKIINTSWAIDSPGTELVMKKRLRRGDYKDLNLYFLKSLRQSAFGYCHFPGKVTKGTDQFYLDGCSQRSDTVPGGALVNFNQGKTAVHEVGHWFGLLHTFQGGCTGNGDYISDTPASASPTYGCPTGRDSCPSDAGLDPINNYMDYSYDSCYNNFSPLQGTRMHDVFDMYRAAG